MHVAILSPFSSGPTRGNVITVRRITDHLRLRGCRVSTLPLDAMTPTECHGLLKRDRPTLLHAFHAYHCGPVARELAEDVGIPYLITITGSDLFDPAMIRDKAARQAMTGAAWLTCFDRQVAGYLKIALPSISKVAVVHQGVWLPPVQEPEPHDPGQFLILLPAALRPVKGIDLAINALAPLAQDIPLRLIIAGGALDRDYANKLKTEAAPLPWVSLLGDVPRDRMGALYAKADLTLNCSRFEGGMANSLLEAMSVGTPVLARDIPGNRFVIRDGTTGWLFADDDALRTAIRYVADNPGQSKLIGAAGQAFVRKFCSPEREAASYLRLYRRTLAMKR